MMRAHLYTATILGLALGASGCDVESKVRSLMDKGEDQRVIAAEERQQTTELRETEPNDSIAQATSLSLGVDMRPIHGAIEPAEDVDWFVLEPPQGESWLVDLSVIPSGDALDAAIYVEVEGEGDFPELLYQVAGPGEVETVPMISVPAEGRRFFVSGADGSAGEYRVEVSRRLSAGAVEVEPNDFAHIASPLAVPGEVQGVYDRPQDRDIFFVKTDDLDPSKVYTLEVSSVAGISQTLRIYGAPELEAALLELTVAEDRPAIIPNIALASGAQGLWFVLTAGEAYDRQRGYRLRVIEHPPEPEFVVEREPNDSAAGAQNVDFEEVVRAYLHAPGDVDRYRFVIEAPEHDEVEYVLDGSSPDAGDDAPQVEADPWAAVPEKEAPEVVAQLTLNPLKEDHRLALRWLPDVESGEREFSMEAEEPRESLTVCNHVLGPGAYDVEVRAAESNFSLVNRSYDYELRLRNVAQTPGLEIEPNDAPEEADRLVPTAARVGFVSTEGDVDYYAFLVGPAEVAAVADAPAEKREEGARSDDDAAGEQQVAPEATEPGAIAEADPGAAAPTADPLGWQPPETESVRVRVKANRLNLRFELLDDERARVAQVNRAGPGADEELAIDLPHGLYYLAVSASGGSSCEPYEVTVERP
ncbi:hypothetical protein [Lujinxingia vulgaris]|uniref:hypothetical protein n=1 Tax=Lujinxingia vulgaris TaxID=2600176 RepID=UPI001E500398|nr:hypothetical protein [Lujinxingia vulgaris]